jgi:hypothetical protein
MEGFDLLSVNVGLAGGPTNCARRLRSGCLARRTLVLEYLKSQDICPWVVRDAASDFA